MGSLENLMDTKQLLKTVKQNGIDILHSKNANVTAFDNLPQFVNNYLENGFKELLQFALQFDCLARLGKDRLFFEFCGDHFTPSSQKATKLLCGLIRKGKTVSVEFIIRESAVRNRYKNKYILVKPEEKFELFINTYYKSGQGISYQPKDWLSIRLNDANIELLLKMQSDYFSLFAVNQMGNIPRTLHNLNNQFINNVLESSKNRKLRLERLKNANVQPEKVIEKVEFFRRNPDIVAEALFRANGICQMCKKNAPFNRNSDGTPYLEVHHIIPLAEGGLDSLDNVIALCPNCHREKHYG